jgi:hypothetical protein
VAVRRLVVVLGTAALLALTGGPAFAEEPFRLDEQVVDEADVLGDESDIDAALEELQTEDGTQLFVVFVDSFDGMDTDQWMQETEDLSGLSGNDALLAVAVDDGAYGFDVPDGADVTRDEADQLAGQAVEPEFADGDWSAGVVAFADILRTGEAPDSGDSGGAGALFVLGAIAVVGGGGYLLARSRRRKRAALPPPTQRIERPDPYAGTSTEELQGRASNALLELDEAVKRSQLDLDYARVQYGEEAVTGFDKALAQSRDEVSRAFTIRQQLDDGMGGRENGTDEATTREMLGEILRLTAAADARLDEQAEAFSKLRDLENTAPQALDALAPRIADLRARVPQEETRLAGLQGRFAPSAVAPVAENIGQARARLDAADAEVGEARAALAAGTPGPAVGDIRAAEDAVAQTVTLLDAIARIATDLDAATGRIAETRAETEKDLAEARSMVAEGNRAELGPQISRAESALTSAGTLLQPTDGSLPDPLAALRQLEEADIALERPSRWRATRRRSAGGRRRRCRRRCSPRGRRSTRPATSSTPAAARSGRRPAPGWPRRGGASSWPPRSAATTRCAPSPRLTRPARSPRTPWISRRTTSAAGTTATDLVGRAGSAAGSAVATAGAAWTSAAWCWAGSCWAAVAAAGSAAASGVAAASAVPAAEVASAAAASDAAAALAQGPTGSSPRQVTRCMIRRKSP